MSTRIPNRLRPIALLVAGCLATSFAVGCADRELERQVAFEANLGTVAAEYRSMLEGRLDLTSARPSPESIAALRALAERATSLSGGTSVQQEAAGALAASIHRSAASIELARAAWLESGQEIVRGMVANATSLASDLEALAEVAESTALGGAKAPADAVRSASSQEIRRLQESIRAIERPLSALEADVSAGAERLARLEQEAAVQLRKARESTPSAGFAFVEEAARIRGDARAVRGGIENQGIEAGRLSSELAVEQSRLAGANALQAAAASVLETLATLDGDLDGAAAKCREMAAGLRAEAAKLLEVIGDERAGALKDAYALARGDLERALSNAGSGKVGEALRNALVVEDLRMRAGELAGIAAEGRLLSVLEGESSAAFSALRTAAEEQIAALKERAAAAADALAAAADDESLAGFKAYVDEVRKGADGMTVATLLAPPVRSVAASGAKAGPGTKAGATTGRSMGGGAAGGAGGVGGIVDLDAFIAQLNELTARGDVDGAADAMAAAVDDSTDLGRAMKNMTDRMMRASSKLTKALQEKFGVATLDLGSGVPGAGQFGVGVMTIQSNDGEFAEVGGAGTETLVFRKSDGVWRIDYLEAMRRRGMSEDQIAMAGPAMAMMGDQLVGVFRKVMDEVAAGVMSGEYATVEAAQQALVEKMAGAAGGLGGLGGGGRGGAGGVGR